MTPKTTALDRGSNPVQLLSALPGNAADTTRSGSFGQVLESSMQPRPAEPVRPQNRSAERPVEAQSPRTGERASRPATAQSDSAAERGQETRNRGAEAGAEASPKDSTAETEAERIATDDNPAADPEANPEVSPEVSPEAITEATDTQDPAKLAVLAAVIAALRGNAAATEAGEAAPQPAARVPQGSTASTLSTDAEAQSGGNRPGDAKTAATTAQLAASSSATVPAATEAAKPVATLRTADAVSALASTVVPSRSAAANGAAAESPAANLPSTAPVATLRAEPAAMQKMLVPTPAGQRLWADDVANRVIWMAGRGDGRAELILTPPNLGKLGVSIQMNGDQTTAHFVTSSSAAREALEQALPRLREALQQAGIMLGDASVSTSSEQQARNGDTGQEGRDNRAQSGEYGILPEATEPGNTARWTQAGTNLVDIFA